MEDLTAGTLADLHTLMTHPPRLRRGHTDLVYGTQPAAGANFTYPISSSYWERIVALAFTFTASATVAGRQINLNLADANGAVFSSTPVAALVTAGQSLTAYGDQQGITPTQWPSSVSAYGSATSAGAGTALVSSPTYPPGDYAVTWTVELAGTLAQGTDNDNFQLRANSATQATSENPAVVGAYAQQAQDVQLTSTGTVVIRNNLAATTGAFYSADLTVTPLDLGSVQMQLPDLVLKSGWQATIQVVNVQAADQISGVYILTERYASNYADGALAADTERRIRWLAHLLEQAD